MPKVLVLYYSFYGHMEQMAYAAAEGARQAGADAVVKRVPELVPEEVARNAHFKLDQSAPVATVDELPSYDTIILGIPTRYGRRGSSWGTGPYCLPDQQRKAMSLAMSSALWKGPTSAASCRW